jgi:hypothetical protein
MTGAVPEPVPGPVRRVVEKCQHRTGSELRRLVAADVEDEAERLRRRFHIHVCLISMSALLTLLSVWSLINAEILICTSIGLNSCQEFCDYVGRY